jgi:hypothetical protein
MLIYLHRHMAHTSAESEETAARLEAQGWVRCTEEVHKVLWKIGDAQAFAVLRRACGTVDTLKERTV